MKLILFPIVLLSTIAFIAIASATSTDSDRGCSYIDIANGGLGDRIFTAWNDGLDVTLVVCSVSGTNVAPQADAGASVSLHCKETATGTVPPGVADASGIIIRGYKDANGFPDSATASDIIWTQTFSSCTTQQDFSKFCTTDGASGTAPFFGMVRLYIRSVRTTVVAYDDASDSATAMGSYGAYRCNPKPTTHATLQEQNPWIGGDTIISQVVVDSAPYNTGNTGTQHTTCSGVETTHNNKAFTTTEVKDSNTVIGSAAVWQTGCTITTSAILTRNSAITGWTSVPYAVWNQASPPPGVTYPSAGTALYTSKVLNRINSPTSSVTVKNGASTVTVFNRGETVTFGQGAWQHADLATVPSGTPATSWLNLAGQYRVTTDFPSGSISWSSAGNLAGSLTATTSATVTSGLSYHLMGEEFNTTARTDAVLLNWGNASSLFDISSTWHFSRLNLATSNNGANTSSFTIAADVEFVRAIGLDNAANLKLSGITVSCFRTLPDLTNEASFSLGTTNANGDTSSTNMQLQVVAPAGLWGLQCDASGSGNTGSYVIHFFHTSPFTANVAVSLWSHLWNTSTQNSLNVTARATQWNTLTDKLDFVTPDDENVRLYVIAQNVSEPGILINLSVHVLMVPLSAANHTYTANVTLPAGNYSSILIVAKMNFTGRTFIGQVPVLPIPLFQIPENLTGNFSGNITLLGTNGTITVVPSNIQTVLIYSACFLIIIGLIYFAVANSAALPAIIATLMSILVFSTTLDIDPHLALLRYIALALGLLSVLSCGRVVRS